jgi:hypothetical protein
VFTGFICSVSVGSILSNQVGKQSRRFTKVLLRGVATLNGLDVSYEVATSVATKHRRIFKQSVSRAKGTQLAINFSTTGRMRLAWITQY